MMNRMIESKSDENTFNERLADNFYKGSRYNLFFLGLTGLGLMSIFWLTQLGIFGDITPQLLYIGIATIVLALLQIPVLALARRKRGIAANILLSFCIFAFSISMVIFWQGITPAVALVVLITPVFAIRSEMPRKYVPWYIVLILIFISGIIYAEYFAGANTTFERLQNNSSAAIASLAFLGATGILLVTITIISQSQNYRSLQGLLLTSFVIIVTIPTIMATVLSGVGAYANSQTQTLNTLKAITNLKENQITLLVDEIRNDADKIQGDFQFKQNVMAIITQGEVDPEQLTSSQALGRTYLWSIQKDKVTYTEIMVLDSQGVVVLSTDPAREGENYETQLFYRQGTVKFFNGFAAIPDFGDQNLIVATPFFDTNGQIIRGVIVLRSDASAIKKIMESTPGFEEAETYLVDKNFNPVTKTRVQTQTVRSKAALSAVLDNLDGQGTYDNYANEGVLGYYKWYEPMQMAVIAEVPVSLVVTSSYYSLAGSTLLSLFAIAFAITAVVISARSIVDPIKDLAQITESYTLGKFSSRANVSRKDEIGALAKSYNQMAAQLQDIIGKLEQRVADRTHELEGQTLRLRVAAEIARDAASVRDLDELLASSAELILKRFNFYHTGIFLIDKNREYAVLTASPTEAGRQMISNAHKLRVGEAGIVGRVAATGEPRIILEAGVDETDFKNPLLPNTRSEMALPLKVGNVVIGVLDVQIDQTQAFSQDDIAIMQVMADQLATAIERTRLLQEVERNLRELETAYGQYTREGWQKLGSSGQLSHRGYRFDNVRIEPIDESPALESKVTPNGANGKNNITIPIKLRGEIIGMIRAKLKEGYGPNTISTIELATERLAAALESARLYEEARTRADREQSISRVSAAISSATEYDEILRTTVSEIGRMLNNTEVTIQILGDSDEQKSDNN